MRHVIAVEPPRQTWLICFGHAPSWESFQCQYLNVAFGLDLQPSPLMAIFGVRDNDNAIANSNFFSCFCNSECSNENTFEMEIPITTESISVAFLYDVPKN